MPNYRYLQVVPDEQNCRFQKHEHLCSNCRPWDFKTFVIIVLTMLLIFNIVAPNHFTSFLLSRTDLDLSDTFDPPVECTENIQHLERQIHVFGELLHELGVEFLKLRARQFALSGLIDDKINRAFSLHEADKTGLIDYAMESNGGYIVSYPDTVPYRLNYKFMDILKFQSSSDPAAIIRPGNLPGECFAFEGTKGKVRVGLSESVTIYGVTLEHTSPKLTDDSGSTPKIFEIYGLQNKYGKPTHNFGHFVYRIDEIRTAQTFSISLQKLTNETYKFVELRVLENYGNPNYTCIYRLRIHGQKLV